MASRLRTTADIIGLRARRFIKVWKREQAAKKDRLALAPILERDMHDAQATTVRPGRSGAVQLVSGSKKCVTKAQLVKTFGKAGLRFWERLRPKSHKYLTVIS